MTELLVSIARGAAARDCMENATFLSRWRQLGERSERASVLQEPWFVESWFRTCPYWEPVVAVAHDSRTSLRGIWPLALDPQTGVLESAGAWLADPGPGPMARAVDQVHVFHATWLALQEEPDWQVLRLRGLATEWGIRLPRSVGIEDQSDRRQRSVRVWQPAEEPGPLVRSRAPVPVSAVDRVRSAHLRFVVASGNRLQGVRHQLLSWHDLRAGAATGACPSRELRGLRELLRQQGTDGTPVLWAAVGFDQERPVVGLWGVKDGGALLAAVPVHAPVAGSTALHAEHLHELGRWLWTQGVARVDLAGGGRLETVPPGFDETRLDIEMRRVARRDTGQMISRAVTRAVGRIRERGVDGATRLVRRHGLAGTVRRLATRGASLIAASHRLRVYRAGPEIADRCAPDARVRCNCLEDLLAFRPGDSWMSRQWFLSTVLERLNAGESVFTIRVDGILAHWGWLVRGQRRARLSEVRQTLALPPGSAVLYDFYTRPGVRGQGLYRSNLGHMLRHAMADPETEQCYISVLDDNAPSRHVIETSDFEYIGTLHWRRRLWWQRTWADRALENGAGPAADEPPG